MFARRTLSLATRAALNATKKVAVARSFGTASSFAEPASRKYLAIGGASLLTAFGMYQTSNFSVSAAESVPIHGVAGTAQERTFIAVKPDGVQRGLVSEVIARFERKGYKLVAIKLVRPSKEFASKHYSDLSTKPFFGGLVEFFSSGPVVAMVWEGKGVIKGGRRLVGATDPNAAEDGSLRGDFCIEVGRNIVHGSDAPDSAEAEINLWFKPEEVATYTKDVDRWVFEAGRK